MSHPQSLVASPVSHPVRVDIHALPHHSSTQSLSQPPSAAITKPLHSSQYANAVEQPGAYERDLDKNRANYCALDPCDFLRRAAQVFPKRIAMIDPATELDVGHPTNGPRFVTYAEMYTRCRRFAHALTLAGIRRGDCVATFSYNTIPALEASFGVPFIGAIINAINFRLNGHEVAFILRHSETKLVFCHVELASVMLAALAEHEKMSEQTGVRIPLPQLIYIHDPNDEERTRHLGRHLDYESFLMGPGVDPNFACPEPRDDWDSICLNYTSGTTGDPKGVVFSNRGVYLAAMGQCVEMGMSPSHWTPTVVDAGRAVDANALPLNITYLWSLPLFHCSGWTYPYAVTAVAGTHVLLRKVRPRSIFEAVRNFKVTHLCGAPTVLDAIAFAPADEQFVPPYIVQVLTGGSAPPERVFGIMRKLNFNVTHIYGLTEVYDPTSICEYQNEWDDYNPTQLAHAKSQQGVRYLTQAEMIVGHTEVGPDGKVKVVQVPRDDKTLGEVLFRGNITMKGYLKNPRASNEAFEGGYFHSGDMASVSPSGYIQIKDRSKDIIISGGENISSLEVQAALLRHPAVLNAAVVAMPHHKWGETPIAFVELKADHLPPPSEKDIFHHCREELATYKCPTKIVFGALPMTSTGKVQKFKLRKIAVDLAHRIGEDTFGTFTAQGATNADQEEDTAKAKPQSATLRAKL